MKTCKIPHTDVVMSRMGYGCAMLGGWDKGTPTANVIGAAVRVVNTAYDNGITFFDHADVYGLGKAEEVFGEVLRRSPGLRHRIVIQSKCGQRLPGEAYPSSSFGADLSRAHIVSSLEGILRRLRTEHLDVLLLHITDALVEPEEVAQAFDELKASGKVGCFGVSNHNAHQIARLQKFLRQPLVVNQIQVSLAHPHPIADGMEFMLEATEELPKMLQGIGKKHFTNAYTGLAGAGTLDYCCLHDIQVQAWSPVRGDVLNPSAEATPETQHTARVLAELAKDKNSTPSAVALAWLLRHPAGIVPIMGATKPEHIVENCAADSITLSRDEWYRLFVSAARLPPQRLSA